MQYILNGERKDTVDQNTLKQILLENIDQIPTGIAVAVDDEIIPRLSWESHEITENQKILIITATQGG